MLTKSLIMKKLCILLLSITMMMLCLSCEKLFKKDDPGELKGDPSPMGEVGVTVESSSEPIAGVSNFTATVTALKDGVSTYSGSATVTNAFLKNMVSNFPGVTINGDIVSITNMKIQQTKDGIKSMTGGGAGILVKYDSNVGDTYPIGSTDKVRTVVAKTGIDDYSYGFFLIKVIQVEDNPSYLKSTAGVTKVTYVANHKFGLVGVKVAFDDGTTSTFPIYTSAEN
jgi:hypothetical protein